MKSLWIVWTTEQRLKIGQKPGLYLSRMKPLAEQLRPQNFEEFVGQEKVFRAQAAWLKHLETQESIPNLLLWGPPGSGKTSFAHIIAKKFRCRFLALNAIDTGAKELREIGQNAKSDLFGSVQNTLVFVDEIHRLNRAQQDVLLPYIEKGDFIFIGATTENPSYQLTGALLSRCQTIVFDRLSHEDFLKLFLRACTQAGIPEGFLSENAREQIFALADGDARKLLNQLEHLFREYSLKQETIDEQKLAELLQQQPFAYDARGDHHHDTISAFIKSIRGSDPDAAVYYLARMIESGEDPLFIARRLVILASEDVGNADPRGISIAVAGMQAVELVGLPEAAINLSQVTTYLACAPKSNRSYMALNKAKETFKNTGRLPIPLALRSAKTKLSKDLGYGKNYQYAHDSQRGWKEMDFLPEQLQGEVFYDISDIGFEKNMKQHQDWKKGSPTKGS